MLPRELPMMLAEDGYRPAHPAAPGAVREAEYTGLQVRVLYAFKARVYEPRACEIAISIWRGVAGRMKWYITRALSDL